MAIPLCRAFAGMLDGVAVRPPFSSCKEWANNFPDSPSSTPK